MLSEGKNNKLICRQDDIFNAAITNHIANRCMFCKQRRNAIYTVL